MSLDSIINSEDEKKKKILTEIERKHEMKKQLEFKKTKDVISTKDDAEKNIFSLKDLVEKWILTQDTADKVLNNEGISEDDIKEIFNKIDEMEEIKDIDSYLPTELRITSDEYFKALNDDIFRVQTLTKLDSALTLLANKINPDSAMWLNLFSWFLTVLDKNLIKVQENTIDVKDSLKEVDKKKFWIKKDNRSIWQKIIDFFKEIFIN